MPSTLTAAGAATLRTTHQRVRVGGWAALVAGVAGAIIGLGLLVVPPAVPFEDFSYPLAHPAFAVVQVLLGLHHLALAVAVAIWWRAGLAGPGALGRLGAGVAVLALAGIAVWEVVAIGSAGQAYPSAETAWLDTGYGLWSIASALGLVLLGVATARSRVVTGWARWIPLAVGVYMVVPMMPAILAGFVPARIALSGWSLLFALLGLALLGAAGRTYAPVVRGTPPRCKS